MSGRTLAIGDIHGCDVALETLLREVKPAAGDTVVVLGDVVDRGPDTKRAIELLLELDKHCELKFILGNHEVVMREVFAGHALPGVWHDIGGKETLASYGGRLEDVPPSHLRFLSRAADFYETATEIFVHASLEPGVSLNNQTSDWLRWKHIGGMEKPFRDGCRVVCGHTSQKDGIPLVLDGWVCIDTFAHGGKYLSCLDVESDNVLQANQSGELREFPLSRYAH